MIKNLLRRYKEGVHPCMLKFLIEFCYDERTFAWYDGDHIITSYSKDYFDNESYPKYKPLTNWTFREIIDSFIDLNQDEREQLNLYYTHIYLEDGILCNNK